MRHPGLDTGSGKTSSIMDSGSEAGMTETAVPQ